MQLTPKIRYILLMVVICSGPVIGAAISLIFKGEGEIANVSILQLLNGLFCILFVLMLPLRKNTKFTELVIVAPLLSLCGFIFVTALFRDKLVDNLVYVSRIFFAVMIFWYFFHLTRNGYINGKIMSIIGWVILITVIISQVMGSVLGISGAYSFKFAMVGVGGKASVLANYLASIVPFFLMRTELKKNDLVGIGLLTFASIFTFKRTLWVVVVLTILLYFTYYFYKYSFRTKIKIFLIALALISSVFYTIIYTPIGLEILYRLADLDVSAGGTASGRTEIWQISAKHFLSMDALHTLFGYGSGYLAGIMDFELNNAIGAHNDWLDIAIAFGVFGLMLFCWFFIRLIRFTFILRMSSDKHYISTLSALMILVIYSISTGGIFNSSFIPLFGLLGYCAAQYSLRSQYIAFKAS